MDKIDLWVNVLIWTTEKKDGFNQEKIDGYRPIDAIEKFVFENIPVHVLPSITHSYEQVKVANQLGKIIC